MSISDETGSARSRIYALRGRVYHCGVPAELDKSATALTDYDHHAITDGCTGEPVA
jgi:hypothetical protein